MERIKLIWDFHGPAAEGTAKHHAIHLKQFAVKEALTEYGHGHSQLSPSHVIAYLIVDREDMLKVRDALRPARATLEEN